MFLSKWRPSLWSIKGIKSVPRACHSTINIDGIGIDLQLPAESLSLRGCTIHGHPSFVALVIRRSRIRIEFAAPETADGENVFSQRNLDVILVDIWHFDGKQQTRIVFLDRDIVILLRKAMKVVCRRHAVKRFCRNFFYRKRAGLTTAHCLTFNGMGTGDS